MKIFLTGSTGFIGGALLPGLQVYGHDVVTDLKYFDKEKYDCIVHLAAVTNIELEFNPWLIETNIMLAKKMLRYPARVIFGSSCSAAHLTNPYAYTKRYGEYLCSKHPNALALRFHNIYGPGARRGIVKFLMDQPNGAEITIRGPELVRDYIHVDDVANAIIDNLVPKKPVFIDMKVLREAANESNLKLNDLVKLAFEQNVYIGKKEYITGSPNTGIMDVGTGVGTETKNLVELYSKVSGKGFDIKTTPPGDNEPASMISNNIVPHMDLEIGLKKLIELQEAIDANKRLMK